MKKQIKLFIVIILLILLMYVPISYAIEAKFELNIKNDTEGAVNQVQNKSDFFTVDSREKEIGSTLNMYINLSQIDYDVSKFTLTSTNSIDNIQNSNGIEIKKENDEFSLIINKNELNIEQIILTYTIPNNFKVGDKFTLIGRISKYEENNVNDADVEKTESNIENNDQENLKEQEKSKDAEKEIKIEITITEKQGNEKEDKKEIENNIEDNKVNKESKKEVEQTQNTSVKNITTNSSNTQTIVYNGSSNNYLENISITDYELNTEFKKENTTYFLTVENDVTSIKVTVTKEDSSSKVYIYGNENLKVGTNKVLISVTAENGDVRNYRIFVNKEA